MKKHILGNKILNVLKFIDKHTTEVQGCIISPELDFLFSKAYVLSSEKEFNKYFKFVNGLDNDKDYIAFEIKEEDINFIRDNFIVISKNLYSLKLIDTPVMFEYKCFKSCPTRDFNTKNLFIVNLNKKGMMYFAKQENIA